MSLLRTQSLVAGTQQSLDSWNGEAVEGREQASLNGIAGIGSASLVVEASNILVYAANRGNTSVSGASALVVTIDCLIEGNKDASCRRIASVLCAEVAIVADLSYSSA